MVGRFGMLTLALFLAAGTQSAQSQDLVFDHLSVEQGLSHAWVHAILKDSVGFMWFGTQDGLNRYDGANIKTYRPRVGVASPIEPRQACRQEGTS